MEWEWRNFGHRCPLVLYKVPESELEDHTHFVDDLCIDSILIIELKTLFEEKYDIKINKEELSDITSLKNIMTYLTERSIQAK